MIDLDEIHWSFDDSVTDDKITSLLAPRFQLIAHVEPEKTYTLLDDHDWAIWHSGAALLRDQEGGCRLHIGDEEPELDCCEPGAKARFYWDFPQGQLRDALKERVKLRALTEKAQRMVVHKRYQVLNRDDKTVVRISVLEHRLAPQKEDGQMSCSLMPSSLITVTPLRGYQKEFKAVVQKLQRWFDTLDVKPETQKPSLRRVFTQPSIQVKPLPPMRYGIAAGEASEVAIRKMGAVMFTRANAQVEGVIGDIDTEFLHDYRVYIRTVRSLINLTKQAITADAHLFLKTELAQLAGATSQLRDLDVFLLTEQDYRDLLPSNYDRGLSELFKIMGLERKRAWRKVVQTMSSEAFEQKTKAVSDELERDADLASKAAKKSALTLASGCILKRYQRICRLGGLIVEDTPDDDVHEVRIDCKKLRYLMQIFAELFEQKPLAGLIKQLKGLQNILGLFNDYSVQKEFLQNYTEGTNRSVELVAAVNALIGVLHQKQLMARRQVESVLAVFATDDISAEFEVLFTVSSKADTGVALTASKKEKQQQKQKEEG
ncbi:MAG: hypothetical protein COA42_05530 [Alteromonadaceae bacterium]|nr:MAG: hypothetical protein COA42_05530 [Alteromonadaceae bacterium]